MHGRADPARARFLTIIGLRWLGLVLVALGLLVLYRRLPLPAALAPWAGYGLIGLGLVAALALPRVLARRWRTPTR